MALVASFAPSLRLGANDVTLATKKQCALQKSSYCSIRMRSLVPRERNKPHLRQCLSSDYFRRKETKRERSFDLFSLLFYIQGKNKLASLSLVILTLKEQCHEDFAVLGQFCAKIITLRL